MKISFHGAARTVTGSKHLIQTQNGARILLDCGLFQGMEGHDEVLNHQWGFDPATVDVVVLSHAHIDHIGLLPKLVREGFSGPIWCTPATQPLVAVLLLDSAEIQEADIRHRRKNANGDYQPVASPLYTVEDAQQVLTQLKTVDYKTEQEIAGGVTLYYTDSGHILGSAAINLTIRESKKTTRLTFSGDIGQYHDLILRAPQPFPEADVVIMESTYGNRDHAAPKPTEEAILDHITETCVRNKGTLIIPAFSVGRTQEILFQLNDLYNKGLLPKLPVFVDSPMALEATKIIKAYPEYFNSTVTKQLRNDEDVFDFPGLQFTESVADSKSINQVKDPCIIIASSGMAEAGRVRHHIRSHIGNPASKILLVGYSEPRSLAGQLKSGAKQVRMFGDTYEVRCQVGSIDSMSAHGDRNDLLRWLSCQAGKPQVCLVHGELDAQEALRNQLIENGFERVHIPALHETLDF
ncbi:MAG: MBL fold metallo-hydrolase [Sphingobacteriales bacterium]|nr:MAG: MBL fold metallo-hydrolase [Sphingobacteriales bacterium]